MTGRRVLHKISICTNVGWVKGNLVMWLLPVGKQGCTNFSNYMQIIISYSYFYFFKYHTGKFEKLWIAPVHHYPKYVMSNSFENQLIIISSHYYFGHNASNYWGQYDTDNWPTMLLLTFHLHFSSFIAYWKGMWKTLKSSIFKVFGP